MDIYLAGGLSGNLSKEFKVLSKLLAGEHPVKNGKEMQIFLAGEHPVKSVLDKYFGAAFPGEDKMAILGKCNILESYAYLRKNEFFMQIIPHLRTFLLDSGAFTFMSNPKTSKLDWDKYTEDYAYFIKKYDIKLFFELDIDPIVGLAEVERLRAKLERLAGRQSIPVWHKNRGKEYYIQMCEEYPYVALGGLVAAGDKNREGYDKYFPWFINTAHRYGAKIHGLGYTQLANLRKYHFDSVDSTAWLYGNRGGYLYRFNPQTRNIMEKIKAPSKNHRLVSTPAAAHNFIEWVKLCIWAEKNL